MKVSRSKVHEQEHVPYSGNITHEGKGYVVLLLSNEASRAMFEIYEHATETLETLAQMTVHDVEVHEALYYAIDGMEE